MTVDTRGRRAAQALVKAAERLGLVPDLDRLRRRRRHRRLGRAGLAVAALVVAGALVAQVLPALERGAPGPVPPAGHPGDDPDLARRPRARSPHPRRRRHRQGPAGRGGRWPSGVWVLNRRDGKPDDLVRVDPATDVVLARLQVGEGVSHLAVGEDGGVWLYRTAMTPDRPELVRVDPSTNRVAATIALPPGPPGIPTGAGALLVAGGSVWLADQHNRLFQVDPATRRVARSPTAATLWPSNTWHLPAAGSGGLGPVALPDRPEDRDGHHDRQQPRPAQCDARHRVGRRGRPAVVVRSRRDR